MLEVIRRSLGHGAVPRVISLVVFLTIMAYSLRSNYERPEWNFDLVGYVAVIASYVEDSPEQVHKSTYDAIRQGVPAGDYKKLVGASGYRKSLSQHASHLMTQVRHYRNKPGYLLAVYVVHQCGVNLARATFLVSLFAYILLALLLWVWLAQRVKPPWATALCVCVMLSHPVFLTARMSAPDMLAALFIVPALLLLIERKWALGGALLLVSMTIRPDMSLRALYEHLRPRLHIASNSYVVLWHPRRYRHPPSAPPRRSSAMTENKAIATCSSFDSSEAAQSGAGVVRSVNQLAV